MLAFLEYLYTDHCSIEDGDSVGILELSNEYMMPRLTSLCELYLKNEVDRATSKSIPLVDIDVICKYNSLYPHTPSLIPLPSYPHTLILLPSYHYPHTLPSYHYPHTLPSYTDSHNLPSYPRTTTLTPSYHYSHTPLIQYMTPHDTHWCQNMTPIDAKHNT